MKLNEIQYKIYVDLDGVLADFKKGVKKLIPDYKDGEYAESAKYRKEMWGIVNKYRKNGGQLWAELDLMDDAMELWDYVKDIKGTEILTATGSDKYDAAEQKRKWVKEKLGSVKVNVVPQSKKKAKFAEQNHILIDDFFKSIDPWKEAGGIGILHTSAKDTIKKLKELGL